ncbi:MAG: threonine synthase [Candidatus Methanolliviera hydrocarbonicum]|uniref:Threonine synthase n=1 Tax=Candidatus Methanolliviera hydrocarbonicum TaxID=2491085 RepID=A0A520KW62_9EURY|nr:MAG: threonine synthase [Candidatus Methanolliviera hydrocarbonicum]
MNYNLRCIRCGREYDGGEVIYTCECGGLLEVRLDISSVEIDKREYEGVPLSVWKYKKLIPIEREPITIKEGGTPLYRCKRLGEKIGVKDLYVKHEGLNPTGSFKDRGMTVGVTKSLELGMRTVACASTGNTSASLAIYGAKAGIPVVVLLPGGKVALGKVAQALMHGAKVIEIKGNFDDALEIIRRLCDEEKFYLLNSINPYRLEGQKTIGYEVADELGWDAPDRIILPVGNAGNISAIYKGFRELKELDWIDEIPKMTGIQADGSAPIVRAFRERERDIVPEKNPETIATAIRIGAPVNAVKALAAIYESGGIAETVTDDEIIRSQKDLARLEGIGVEPASATSLAGLKKLVEKGEIDRDERIVCITTGNLMKDPEEVVDVCDRPTEVEASLEAVKKALKEM